jgi:vacuolar-type H+-ATPase subunit H
MAKETVQAVRQAELNAAQIEKEAQQKKDNLLTEAQQNAKAIIISMTKEAQRKAEDKLREANNQAAQLISAAKQRADMEAQLMKELVRGKEQSTIDQVLSSLI